MYIMEQYVDTEIDNTETLEIRKVQNFTIIVV